MNSAQDGASAPAQEHGAGMQEHKGARGARSDRGSTVSTARKDPGGGSSQDVAVPALGPLGMLRWAWAQLTKMNTALFLVHRRRRTGRRCRRTGSRDWRLLEELTLSTRISVASRGRRSFGFQVILGM